MTESPLTTLIQLEQLDSHLFKGQNYAASWGTVFGGQVLAQSIHAASRTVPEGRVIHSMHGYFILPGNLDIPITYQVEPIRDGGSFNTRRVVAFQDDRAIYNMSASFQQQEDGFTHQIEMPQVTSYKDLPTEIELAMQMKDKLPESYLKLLTNRNIEFRPVENIHLLTNKKSKPVQNVWMKCEEKLPNNPALHCEVLAYASDFNLLTTSLLPYLGEFKLKEMQMASLDHAMWFHRSFRADEWLLFTMESPSASNSRGFNWGSIFTESGELVASVTQEGLIRNRSKQPKG